MTATLETDALIRDLAADMKVVRAEITEIRHHLATQNGKLERLQAEEAEHASRMAVIETTLAVSRWWLALLFASMTVILSVANIVAGLIARGV